MESENLKLFLDFLHYLFSYKIIDIYFLVGYKIIDIGTKNKKKNTEAINKANTRIHLQVNSVFALSPSPGIYSHCLLIFPTKP